MKLKHVVQVLGVLLSVAALYLVFQGVDFREFLRAFGAVNYGYLVPSLAVFYLSVWLRGVRWRWLFQPRYDVPLSHATGGIFICFAFNSIFPFRVGEFARAVMVGKRDRTGFSTAFGTVVAERLLDSLTLLPCLVVALAIAPINEGARFEQTILGREVVMTGAQFLALKNKVVVMALVLLVSVLALSLPRSRGWCLKILHAMKFLPDAFRRRLETLVHKFAEGLASFRSPRRILVLLALSLVIWLVGAFSVQVLAWGFPFDHTMTFTQSLALVVIICIFIMLPAAPGYWGFYEAGAVFSLAIMGIHGDRPTMVSYAILMHLCQWVPIVAVGLPWAWLWGVSIAEAQAAGQTEADAD
jgi:hypothetical protein